MIIASHCVFAAYGFWLPNDPRGSWSNEVWAEHLQPFGDVHKVSTRRSLARAPHDRNIVRQAKDAMLFPPVRFNDAQRQAIADGFAEIVPILGLTIYACAILQDHVHIVSARYRENIETIIGFLKRAATRRLNQQDVHPLSGYRRADGIIPTPWVRGGWKRYLDSVEEIAQAIEYVRSNPHRAGLPGQRYAFETELRWT